MPTQYEMQQWDAMQRKKRRQYTNPNDIYGTGQNEQASLLPHLTRQVRNKYGQKLQTKTNEWNSKYNTLDQQYQDSLARYNLSQSQKDQLAQQLDESNRLRAEGEKNLGLQREDFTRYRQGAEQDKLNFENQIQEAVNTGRMSRQQADQYKADLDRQILENKRMQESLEISSHAYSNIGQERDRLQRERDTSHERHQREYGDLESRYGGLKSQYGDLESQYGDLESQMGQQNRARQEKRRVFQETYDKDYIEKQLLPVIQKHYPLSSYPGYKDLESMKQYPGSGYKPGMTGEEYKNKWDHPNYQHVYKQFPSYQPPQSRYDVLKSDYDMLQKRNSETESMYQGKIADFEKQQENEFNKYIHEPEIADQILRQKYDLEKGLYDMTMKKTWPEIKSYAEGQGYKGNYKKYENQYVPGASQQKPFMDYEEFEKRNHNKAFMTSLMPQFEAKYPKGDRDEAQHLTNLGYGDPTYAKDPISFLKQYQKYYPFANEETYQKYPTTDKFRDFSPASKQYLNIDQPNFENFNKIYQQKLRDQESMSANEIQSQFERFSNLNDQSVMPFADYFKKMNPQQYEEIMAREQQNPKYSQFSIFSQNAPKALADGLMSEFSQREKDLNSVKSEKDSLMSNFSQVQKEYDTARQKAQKEQMDQEIGLKKAQEELNALRKYRAEISPLRRNYPSLQSALNQHQKNSAVLTNQNKELLAWKNMHKGAAADYYRKIASNTIPGISYKDVYDAQQMLKKL